MLGREFLIVVDRRGTIRGVGGDNTDVGDLTVIVKAALLNERPSGNVISVGLAVTAPTGPDTFAGEGKRRSSSNSAATGCRIQRAA